ncbi:hypothetical protein [Rhizobium leguminosarum]|uniref:hypothetical protein n=1 Tax=Rhizobium leguminosarum TaxID=384 RepID=UPI00197E1C09|nr:hypothetical protein [Rhizobium leguminosarum]
MARRKQTRQIDVKDIRSILRLTYEPQLSVRAISERLKIRKTTVSTDLLHAWGGRAIMLIASSCV